MLRRQRTPRESLQKPYKRRSISFLAISVGHKRAAKENATEHGRVMKTKARG
jgi:hypothetical protein